MDSLQMKLGIRNCNIMGSFNDANVRINAVRPTPMEHIRFHVSEPSPSFVGRDSLLQKIKLQFENSCNSSGVKVLSLLRVLCGLGGMGKTETAREFVRRYDSEYEHIVWINAETRNSMTEDFTNVAANFFSVDLYNNGNVQKPLEHIVYEVYELACRGSGKKTSLFVFDNAEDLDDAILQNHEGGNDMQLDGISFFLPKSIPSSFTPPCFLITSRNKLWKDDVVVLNLEVFTKEEALAFIEKVLSKIFTNIRSTQFEAAEELIQMLGYLPLALEEAAAYIKVTNEQRKETLLDPFTIQDYVDLHNHEAKKLLGENKSRLYKIPIYVTWNVTITRIAANNEGGKLAIRILRLISYLAPDNVPKDLIMYLVKDDTQDVNVALYLLCKYVLLKVNHETKSYSIHRLVQQVTREKCKDDGTEEFYMTSLIAGLKSYQAENLHFEEGGGAKVEQNYVDSVLAFCSHFKGQSYMTELGQKVITFMVVTANQLHNCGKYQAALNMYSIMSELANVDAETMKDEKVKAIMENFSLEIENSMGVAYYDMGDFDNAIPVLHSLIEKRTRLLGPGHADTLAGLNNLAIAYSMKGNLAKARELQKRIAQASADNLTPQDPQFFVQRMNMAKILRNEGNLPGALRILEEIAATKAQVFGENDNDTLKSRSMVANLKFKLGKKKEALAIYRDINARRDSTLTAYTNDHLQSLHCMATILDDMDDFEESLPIFEQVYDGFKELHGPDHHLTLRAQGDVARNFEKQKLYAQALQVYTQIFQKQRKQLSPTNDSLLSTLDDMARMHFELGNLDKALTFYEKILEQREAKTAYDVNIPATRHSIAMVLRRQGKLEEALKMYRIVEDNRVLMRGPDHPDTIAAKLDVAKILFDKGDFEKALEYYQAILPLQVKSLGEEDTQVVETKAQIDKLSSCLQDYKADLEVRVPEPWWRRLTGKKERVLQGGHPKRLSTLVRRSSTLREKGKYESALYLLNEVRSWTDKSKDDTKQPPSPDFLKALNNMGNILLNQGKFNEAFSIHNQVLELREKFYPHHTALLLSSKNNLATCLLELGKFKLAAETFQSVADQRAKLLGPEDLGTVSAYKNLAKCFMGLHSFHKAEKVLGDLMERVGKKCGPELPEVLSVQNTYAVLLRQQGKLDEALKLVDEIIGIEEPTLGENHPYLLISLNNKANILRMQGHLDAAYDLLDGLAAKRKHLLGPFHPDTMTTFSDLADVLLQQGDLEDAYKFHRTVFTNRKETLGSDHPDTLTSMFNMAEVLSRQVRVNEAVELLKQVGRSRKFVLGENHPDTITAFEMLHGLMDLEFEEEEVQCDWNESVGSSNSDLID